MNYHKFFALPNSWRVPMAFDPGKAGWKLAADGKTIEMKDGNPIWIDANGGESMMAGDAIATRNREAKELRIRAETAEATVATFKDIDPVAAKKAIDLVKNIDAKKLIDAGEVDKVRNEISQQFTVQLGEKDKAIQSLTGNLESLQINNIFAQSDFIRDSIAVPRDMFEATFIRNFKIVDGKPQAFDKAGNRIMSKQRIGEYAEPGEALEILVDQHPQKATILKAAGHSGGGNNGGGGNRGGVRTITRADFEKLQGPQAAAAAAEMGKGQLNVVDN